jgi:alpha-beta hydrolase superfamily lysophospholipase
MAATKLINLLALLTIAVLACSFNATPANAITIHGGVLPHGPHSHGTAAKRRLQARQVKNRANTKRCKPRPSSALGSPAPASTSQAAAAAPTSPAAAPTSEAAVSITIATPPPATTTIVDHSPVTQKAADPTPVYTPPSNGGGGGGKVGIAWNNPDTQSLRNLKQGQVSM